eukprot:4002953-Amphidinium_carterae.2
MSLSTDEEVDWDDIVGQSDDVLSRRQDSALAHLSQSSRESSQQLRVGIRTRVLDTPIELWFVTVRSGPPPAGGVHHEEEGLVAGAWWRCAVLSSRLCNVCLNHAVQSAAASCMCHAVVLRNQRDGRAPVVDIHRILGRSVPPPEGGVNCEEKSLVVGSSCVLCCGASA